jgi:hypothetical protein
MPKHEKTLKWYRVYWHKAVGVSRVLATSKKEALDLATEFCDGYDNITEVRDSRMVESRFYNPTDEDPFIGDIREMEITD